MTDYSKRLCKFCGEVSKGVLCPTCKTKEQRKKKYQNNLNQKKKEDLKLKNYFVLIVKNYQIIIK